MDRPCRAALQARQALVWAWHAQRFGRSRVAGAVGGPNSARTDRRFTGQGTDSGTRTPGCQADRRTDYPPRAAGLPAAGGMAGRAPLLCRPARDRPALSYRRTNAIAPAPLGWGSPAYPARPG